VDVVLSAVAEEAADEGSLPFNRRALLCERETPDEGDEVTVMEDTVDSTPVITGSTVGKAVIG